ncbi:MAG TPA: DUF4091 domain-containing protein [Spirochaetia bacterium]|nr:DUF4091 domain-containing protein [Spirochaetia bacterium]
MNTEPLQTRCLPSLAKVFADEPLDAPEVRAGSALANEVYSFQVAWYSDRLMKGIRVRVDSDLAPWITVRAVGLVPSELPWRDEHDADVLRTTPGLYPDPLYPIDPAEGLTAFPEQWRSLWVTVDLASVPASPQPGVHSVRIVFESELGIELAACEHNLEIVDETLPEQDLIHTEWFHSDCLATYYDLEVFGDEHWRRIAQFIETAARHGVNMILTPIFTPPLDTEVGGERPTVQLVDVTKRLGPDGAVYEFGFTRLERWVELCSAAGIEYFEFSHLFTQWGAAYCPKIVAEVNGETTRIFGWDTPATEGAYGAFLDQFLPAIVAFIRANDLVQRSYFHVSDEPRLEQLEQYRAARELITHHLSGFPIMDALSRYEFYEDGVVDLPIPASNHIEPFIENDVRPLWTYYCVSQKTDVSNRFFCMPSARNRVLGTQLYKFNVAGFLHWGYNFWYTQYSRRAVNPFITTDAGSAFPSGDAFLVYPGESGPISSIRLEVLREALQDLRALRLLESRVGREQALALLEAGLEKPITFGEYPRSDDWVLDLRRRVNEAISEA